MHDISEISKAIEKKKQLDVNLPKYAAGLKTLYFRLSSMKLCFNYYMFAQQMDEQNGADEVKEIFDRLSPIVARQTFENADQTVREEDIVTLRLMRKEIIAAMEILTAYVDRLSIYEYLLNRLEFRFSEEEFNENYYETHFTNDIMHYILENSDSTVTNQRICEIVSQLPMRLTRQKFFELLKDSFSLYVGSDYSAVEDFAYMIRTLSGVYMPEGMGTRFPDIKEMYDILADADYANADRAEYERLADALSVATEISSGLSDMYIGLMELVNDTYILAMTADAAITDAKELSACHGILREAMGKDSDTDVNDCFIFLEGHQERVYNQISANDYIIDMVPASLKDEAKSAGVTEEYEVLRKCAKLCSGSLFVKTEEQGADRKAQKEDVAGIYEEILSLLQESFKDRSVMINRAVMAIVLGSLPVFFNSVDEIQNYINTSLSQCRNRAERMACVALIQMIINEA